MDKKKITCPNCNLQIEENLTKCPFCGADIDVEEIKKHADHDAKTPAKKGMPQHTLFYLIGLGVSLALLLAMILPGESNVYAMIYRWAFVGTSISVKISGTDFVIGSNVATIVFVFSIVAILNQAAVLRSALKKTTEIALFSYFSVFFFVLIAVLSCLSNTLMSMKTAGLEPTQFKFGVGFAIVAAISLVCAAIDVFAVIKYKKYLKSNPLETFKHE